MNSVHSVPITDNATDFIDTIRSLRQQLAESSKPTSLLPSNEITTDNIPDKPSDDIQDEQEFIKLVDDDIYTGDDVDYLVHKHDLSKFAPSHLPPWIPVDKVELYHYIHSPILQRLHNEILWFCDYLKPTHEEQSKRLELIDILRTNTSTMFPGSRLEVFGSYMSNTYLPFGDMDVVLFLTPDKEAQTQLNIRQEIIRRNDLAAKNKNKTPLPDCTFSRRVFSMIAMSLQSSNLITDVEIVSRAKVPVMKCIHIPTGLSIDITLNATSGLETGTFIIDAMSTMPQIRPLTLILKYFIHIRGLNSTFTGGIGSFMLQCMIISMLQRHPGRVYKVTLLDQCVNALDHRCNLGLLLLSFFRMYTYDLNYHTTQIRVDGQGSLHHKTRNPPSGFAISGAISLINPTDSKHDVGANSYNIANIRTAFLYGYNTIINAIKLAHGDNNRDDIPSTLLNVLLPLSPELILVRQPYCTYMPRTVLYNIALERRNRGETDMSDLDNNSNNTTISTNDSNNNNNNNTTNDVNIIKKNTFIPASKAQLKRWRQHENKMLNQHQHMPRKPDDIDISTPENMYYFMVYAHSTAVIQDVQSKYENTIRILQEQRVYNNDDDVYNDNFYGDDDDNNNDYNNDYNGDNSHTNKKLSKKERKKEKEQKRKEAKAADKSSKKRKRNVDDDNDTTNVYNVDDDNEKTHTPNTSNHKKNKKQKDNKNNDSNTSIPFFMGNTTDSSDKKKLNNTINSKNDVAQSTPPVRKSAILREFGLDSTSSKNDNTNDNSDDVKNTNIYSIFDDNNDDEDYDVYQINNPKKTSTTTTTNDNNTTLTKTNYPIYLDDSEDDDDIRYKKSKITSAPSATSATQPSSSSSKITHESAIPTSAKNDIISRLDTSLYNRIHDTDIRIQNAKTFLDQHNTKRLSYNNSNNNNDDDDLIVEEIYADSNDTIATITTTNNNNNDIASSKDTPSQKNIKKNTKKNNNNNNNHSNSNDKNNNDKNSNDMNSNDKNSNDESQQQQQQQNQKQTQKQKQKQAKQQEQTPKQVKQREQAPKQATPKQTTQQQKQKPQQQKQPNDISKDNKNNNDNNNNKNSNKNVNDNKSHNTPQSKAKGMAKMDANNRGTNNDDSKSIGDINEPTTHRYATRSNLKQQNIDTDK